MLPPEQKDTDRQTDKLILNFSLDHKKKALFTWQRGALYRLNDVTLYRIVVFQSRKN